MNRLSTTLCLLVLLLAILPNTAWACEHCFGAAVDTMTTRGIAVSMASLLGFTGFVGTGVMKFFRGMARRARMLEAGDLVVNEMGELVEKES
jgi:hypothetical protein